MSVFKHWKINGRENRESPMLCAFISNRPTTYPTCMPSGSSMIKTAAITGNTIWEALPAACHQPLQTNGQIPHNHNYYYFVIHHQTAIKRSYLGGREREPKRGQKLTIFIIASFQWHPASHVQLCCPNS